MNIQKDSIHKILEQKGIFSEMFDIIRLVDAKHGRLLECASDGTITDTVISCVDVFGTDERCKNCTSMRAYYANETVTKLEYAGNSVLLVFSTPITVDGERVVAELVKDITKSMTVNMRDDLRTTEVPGIIDNLNRIATTDALTQLHNRFYLDEKLPGALESCRAIKQPLSAAMLDLDDFKRVNDVYGHAAGDLVITSAARILSSCIRRGSDWAARYGGEEFFVCLPGIDKKTAWDILERVRTGLESAIILHQDKPIHVTVSIGLSQATPRDTAETLLARCDQLLYSAKHQGKNRVVLD